MSRSNPRTDLQSADVQWPDGLPVSRQFDDIYYSREDGLAESRHVFIEGNRLPARWSALPRRAQFTICETGFGTGLNFLCAVRLWLDISPPDAQLHFISVEKFPLDPEAMARALGLWPELAAPAMELLEHYPPPLAGVHRLWLYNGRVCLTLIFDDAVAGLEGMLLSDHPQWRDAGPRVVDAWFLDGFAPAKNPELWNADLFGLMIPFSHRHTTLATFTVARVVREGLSDVGFALEKSPGFGRKRDMLRGHYGGAPPALADPDTYQPPRVLRNSKSMSPWYLSVNRASGKAIAIIGAGIAGCATAAALKRRGFEVTLYDLHGCPAMEASGNPQGILYPKLSMEDSPLSLFGRHALCYSACFYRPYWKAGYRGNPCGVLALPENEKVTAQFEQIGRRFSHTGAFVSLVHNKELRQLAGVSLDADSGLFFPNLGWVNPGEVCAWLANQCEIVKADIRQIKSSNGTDAWQLLDENNNAIADADHVVFANSFRASEFEACETLPLRPVRGQITGILATAESAHLRTVLCGAGYLAPADENCHTLGATYGLDETDIDLRANDHLKNLATLARTDDRLPSLFRAESANPAEFGGRAAIRCTTPDYLPIVGPVAHAEQMRGRFAALGKNAKADIPLPGCFYPGLWINVGHGSRGMTYAPLAAELLAAQINGEIYPIPRQLAVALSPARFIIRQVKRNQV